MACGSVPKTIELKQKLSAINFPELIFSIKSSKLKFDCNDGAFKQISNDDPSYKKPNENLQLATEEEKLSSEIDAKKKKLQYIKEKLEEVNKKIEIMNKVLVVDLNERDYLNELKTQCGNTKYKNPDLHKEEEIEEV